MFRILPLFLGLAILGGSTAHAQSVRGNGVQSGSLWQFTWSTRTRIHAEWVDGAVAGHASVDFRTTDHLTNQRTHTSVEIAIDSLVVVGNEAWVGGWGDGTYWAFQITDNGPGEDDLLNGESVGGNFTVQP